MACVTVAGVDRDLWIYALGSSWAATPTTPPRIRPAAEAAAADLACATIVGAHRAFVTGAVELGETQGTGHRGRLDPALPEQRELLLEVHDTDADLSRRGAHRGR